MKYGWDLYARTEAERDNPYVSAPRATPLGYLEEREHDIHFYL